MRGREAWWWRVLVSLAVSALVVIACCRSVWGADFWWQLKAGELIAKSGIPTHDTLSFASAGNEWIELRWLFCLALHYLVLCFGYAGPIVMQCLFIGAAFLFAFKAVPANRNQLACLAVLALAVVVASPRFFVRPEMVTYFLFALFIYLIVRWREGGGKGLLLLPFLQIVWTNSHTLFLLGPALLVLLLLAEFSERRGRRMAQAFGVLAACCLACLVNPYGFHGAVFPFQLLAESHSSVFKDSIPELMGPFHNGITSGSAWLVALAATVFVSAWPNRRSIDRFLMLACVLGLSLALMSVRNVPLFALASVPFIIANLNVVSVPSVLNKAIGGAAAVFCLLACGAMVTNRLWAWQGDTTQFGFGVVPHKFASGVADYLDGHPVKGPMFTTMVEGSYLLWRGYSVFMDPRLEVHGEAPFLEYLRMQTGAAAWTKAERKYGFRSAVVELDSTLATRLARLPGWRLAYFDEVAAVYERSPGRSLDIAARASILKGMLLHPRAEWWQPVQSSAPLLKLSRFLVRMGYSRDAADFRKMAGQN